MSKPIQFSIVINNYNYEKYVGKAIDSALTQTYPNVQVVIVDDGSTDKSADVIDAFADKALIIKKPNGGQGSAVNAGFAKATGDVVIILDSDDYLYPNACSEIAAAWRNETSMCCYMLDVCNQHGDLTGAVLPDRPLLTTGHREYVLKYGYIPVAPMSGAAYARGYLERFFPLDEKVWFTAFDGLFAYVSPLLGEISTIKRTLGAYRVGHASLSQHKELSLKKLRATLIVLNNYADAIQVAAESSHGINIIKNKILGPYYWRNRLLSYVASDGKHPYVAENKFNLLSKSIRSFILWESISLLKRFKGIATIFLLVILPPAWIASRIAKKLGVNLSAN